MSLFYQFLFCCLVRILMMMYFAALIENYAYFLYDLIFIWAVFVLKTGKLTQNLEICSPTMSGFSAANYTFIFFIYHSFLPVFSSVLHHLCLHCFCLFSFCLLYFHLTPLFRLHTFHISSLSPKLPVIFSIRAVTAHNS